jgi:hypothetical protein
MKRLFLAICLFAAVATTQCFGQTVISKAAVPFAFEAGTVSFRAGEYTLYQTNGLIRIRMEDGKHSAFMQSIPVSNYGKPDQNCLRFRVYGDKYFLSEIWTGEGGHAVPMSKTERVVAQNFRPVPARNDTIAANRLSK